MHLWLRRSLGCLCLLACCASFAATPSAALRSADFAPRFEAVGAGVIPRDVVPAFVQDRAGFLWIATGDGLVRFDGYQFRPQERQSSNPIQRNLGWIRALLAGRDGRVWIGTESSGLAAYDPATDRVIDYGSQTSPVAAGSKASSALASPAIRALAEDAEGRIYIGSAGGGLEQFDPQASTFTRYTHSSAPGALPDDRIQALLVDSHQTLWVGSWAGLARRPRGSAAFEPVGGYKPGLVGHQVQALAQASDGRIWVGTQDGTLAIVDPATGQTSAPIGQAAASQRGAVTSIVETADHEMWVGRSGGIQIFDALSGALLHQLQHDARRPGGLAGNEVTQLLVDRAGWVWVSGFGLGLQRHNPGNKSIWLREGDLAAASPLNNPDVRSLLPLSSGDIWAATQAGSVAVLDRRLQVLGQVKSLAAPVSAMAQMADGTVWLGSNARLTQYSPAGHLLRTLEHPAGQTRRLFAASDGALWVGTQDGVYRLADGANLVQRWANPQGEPKGEVHAFAEGRDRAVWIGSSAGLYRVAAGSREIQRVPEAGGAGLSNAIVIGLLFDRHDTLWVDTGVGGLHRMRQWDGQQAAFDRVSERHGVMGKPFGANLLEDARGRIWTHMHVYDPGTDRFTELTPADGATLGTGWFFSYAKALDGRLLFGGSKGILVVRPELFDVSAYAPPLLVSELHINGEQRPIGDVAKGVDLGAADRSFSIAFTALDYADPGRLEYAYMLKNFDPDWIRASANQRLASYSNLKPGSYQLRIRATNRSGVWSPVEQSITIRIAPAWWQQDGFVLLVLLLVALALAGVIHWRTVHLRQRQKALEQMVRDRTAELETLALELQTQQQALEESSVRDPLTGLNNRRFLAQCLDADLAFAVRAHEGQAHYGEPLNGAQDLLFFLFDIDHFKNVNDTFGHLAGDEVLKQLSLRLKSVFRDTDYLIRWGGEEFLGVARQTDRKNAQDLAERARAIVAEPPFVLEDGSRIQVTVSVGFSCFPLLPDRPRLLSWVDMVKIADSALYTVKHHGRNGWVGALACTGSADDVVQACIKQPLVEWIASGSLQYALSASVQVAMKQQSAGPS